MTFLEPVRSTVTETPGDRSGDALESRLAALYTHLEATAELPIDPKTNRWLGEAEAVARDAATGDVDPETARERVRQVRRLLSEADDPAHEEAAFRVEAARECCTAILQS